VIETALLEIVASCGYDHLVFSQAVRRVTSRRTRSGVKFPLPTLLGPLVLALSGHDDDIVRALIPAWVPLAVVVGAACTVPRAWAAGAAGAAAILQPRCT
jgi:hypothetical protein